MRAQSDDRALVFAERGERHALGGRLQRGEHRVALGAATLELIEHALHARAGFAVQRGAAVALQAGLAEQFDVGIPDRRGEQRTGWVDARVEAAGVAHAAREHIAIGGKDLAPVDPLLLE